MTVFRMRKWHRRNTVILLITVTILCCVCIFGYKNSATLLEKDKKAFAVNGNDKKDIGVKYNKPIDRTNNVSPGWKDDINVHSNDITTDDDYFEHLDMQFEKMYKLSGIRIPAETRKQQYSAMSNYWKSVDDGIGKYNKLYQNDFNVDELLVKMKTAKIINITFFLERPTMKWILTLDGGQKVLFKPELHATNISYAQCRSGCERPSYEVTGFHINRMLGLNSMPFTTSRALDWFKDIQPIASEAFTKTYDVYTHSNKDRKDIEVCVHWECAAVPKSLYCFQKGLIPGSIMYWVNRDIMELQHFSPYKQNYSRFHPMYFRINKDNVKAYNLKTGDIRFCDKFRQKAPYNDTINFVHILDMSVEDFLTQSKNSKHNIMYLNSSSNASINVVFDKGKGFCNYKNDLLLAPIYQCCKIRQHVYETLVKVNGTFVNDFLKAAYLEPAETLVDQKDLGDIGIRISVLLNYVETCFSLKGKDNVLV